MKVLFDAFWWVEGPTANRTVLREIVCEWVKEYPEDEILLAVPKKHILTADVPTQASVIALHSWPHSVSNVFELAFHGWKTKADVIFSHNYTPLFGPTATFIHDLMFQERKEWFSLIERAYFAPMAFSARRANSLFTSTRTEAARIERLNPRLRPVVPVGLAVSTAMQAAAPTPPIGVHPKTQFSLSVGRLNVRKNLEKVIEAARICNSINAQSPLLIVGAGEYADDITKLPDAVREAVASGSVKFLGYVGDNELTWLYAHAALTIYLSLDEGFGLPPIEAAHFGSPLLVSDIPVFHETCEENANYVDPLDAAAISSKIDEVWSPRDSSTPPRLQSGCKYTWNKTVRRIRDSVSANTAL